MIRIGFYLLPILTFTKPMASNDPTTRGGPQQNQRKNPTAKKTSLKKTKQPKTTGKSVE